MSCYKCPPLNPIIDPPQVIYRDYYHPQPVQIIHQIEVVNRHHCIPVPQHIYTCIEKDETCAVTVRKASIKNKSKISHAKTRR